MKKNKIQSCCGSPEDARQHPDHSKELNRLSRITGQLEGVRRMIAEREYCPKILTQIQAIRAALRSLEAVILERHLEMCVMSALNSESSREAETKIAEVMELVRRN